MQLVTVMDLLVMIAVGSYCDALDGNFMTTWCHGSHEQLLGTCYAAHAGRFTPHGGLS